MRQKPMACGVAVSALFGLSLVGVGSEPPAAVPPESNQAPSAIRMPAESRPPSPRDDPRAREAIRDALDGKETGVGNDEMLGDVIQIIRQRGSILEGSLLDDDITADSETETTTDADADRDPIKIRNDRAKVAEQLLRSSRLLLELGPATAERTELVKRMRAEAAGLLAE